MEIEIRLPALFDAQREIVEHPARFKVLDCGRRFGKTAIAFDQTVEPIANGYPVAWFYPTKKMGKESWRELRSLLKPLITSINNTDQRMEFRTGGTLEFWSLDDPDRSARGRKYYRVFIDEAAHVVDGTAFARVIRPTLADFAEHPGSGAYIMSTPRGRNWFYQMYLLGKDDTVPDWYSWKKTSYENPYMPASDFDSARLTMPLQLFEQEYLAEFHDDASSVFRNVRACATAIRQKAPHYGMETVMGIDWGRHQDYTVIVVLDKHGNMVDMDRFREIDWTTQRLRVGLMARKWMPQIIIAEQNNNEANLEILARQGLPIKGFQTTGLTKAPLINNMALGFEMKKVRVFNEEVILAELEAYEQTISPAGHTKYGAPAGMHDDIVIALCLAWHGLLTRGVTPVREPVRINRRIGLR